MIDRRLVFNRRDDVHKRVSHLNGAVPQRAKGVHKEIHYAIALADTIAQTDTAVEYGTLALADTISFDETITLTQLITTSAGAEAIFVVPFQETSFIAYEQTVFIASPQNADFVADPDTTAFVPERQIGD